jgi:hypothetical protein
MAKFFDEADRVEIQTKVQKRLHTAADVIIDGSGVGNTGEWRPI